MIIIIEGIDGSGKSTLAKQISKQTGYPIVHRSNPKSEDEKKRMHEEYLLAISHKKNVIFDRCWYSEMAYGPVMRDASCITYAGMYELEKRLAKSGAMIIYCTGPKSALWNRAMERGESYVVSKDQFNTIYDNYEDLFSIPHYVPVVHYEYKEV